MRKISASTKENVTQTVQKPAAVNTKSDRATMTENVINIHKSQQQQTGTTTNKNSDPKFITSAVHRVGQPNIQSVISDNKNTVSKFVEGIDESQIRRKDPSVKPEIPARPSSLSMLKSSTEDGLLKRTQCSMYNVANKQQPSFINIQSKNELFQPGHDTQITEKERFLGHKPDIAPRDNHVGSINANCTIEVRSRSESNASKPPVAQRENTLHVEDPNKMVKSNEQLNSSSDQLNCDNGNQKSSHTRARSDGGMIDFDRGSNLSLQAAPRNLNKPTQPPPPPPPGV